MNKTFPLLILSLCCACGGQEASFNTFKEPNYLTTINQEKLRGTLANGRYYAEDGNFNCITSGFDGSECKISEIYEDDFYKIVLESKSELIRYDVYSCLGEDFFAKLEYSSNFRQEILLESFNQLILPLHKEVAPSMSIVGTEMIPEEEGDGWMFLAHIPSTKLNNACKDPAGEYFGIAVTVKNKRFITIGLVMDSTRNTSMESAKEALFTKLRHYNRNLNG